MVRCWMGDESYQKAIADRRMIEQVEPRVGGPSHLLGAAPPLSSF
jgi:hypothetical protein